jgi:hypothetical protein
MGLALVGGLQVRFPVALDRTGWSGQDERGRGGSVCPVQPQMRDTWGASRPGGRTHEGVDVFAARGTVIYSPESGRVRVSEGPIGGRQIRLTAGARTWTFSHLEEPLVGDGSAVSEGEPIGRVGTSGDAAGLCPHVHVELRQDGHLVNPFELLSSLMVEAGRVALAGELERVAEAADALDAIAAAWEASGVELAAGAAGTLRDVTNQARRMATSGRPDAALRALRELMVTVERAPEDWRTPDSVVTRARRLLEASSTALAAAGAGAAFGGVLGLVAVGAALYLWSKSRR